MAKVPPAQRRAPHLRRDRRPAALVFAGDGITTNGADGHAVQRSLPGAIVDGEVRDAEVVGAALRELAREHRLPRHVNVALADPRLVTRVLRVPAALTGEQLTSAARLAASDVLPIGADELSVGVGLLGGAPDDPKAQRVLLTAARRDAIERLQRALGRARLTADRIEPAGATLARTPGPAGTTLRVNAAGVTTVAVSEDGRAAFTHVAGGGIDRIVADLVDRLSLSEDRARAWVHAVGQAGLDAPSEQDADLGEEVTRIVREGLLQLAADVRNALAFHRRGGDAPDPATVVLTGAAAAWPDLRAILERELELPVTVPPDTGDPLLSTLARQTDGDIDLRLAGRVRGARRPLRSGRALPAALAGLTLLCGVSAAAVQAHRGVGSREAALVAERDRAAELDRRAAVLAPYGRIVADRTARERAAAAVLAAQLPWDDILDDLAAVAPSGVRLKAVRLSAAPAGRARAGGGPGEVAGVRATRQAPAIELRGCARSQPTVARQLDALLAVRGVTSVALDRAKRGACDGRRPVAFTAVAFLEDTKGATR